jgi:hypothetical protein
MLDAKLMPPLALILVVPPPLSVTASKAVNVPIPNPIPIPDKLIPPVAPESKVRLRLLAPLSAVYAAITAIAPTPPFTMDSGARAAATAVTVIFPVCPAAPTVYNPAVKPVQAEE